MILVSCVLYNCQNKKLLPCSYNLHFVDSIWDLFYSYSQRLFSKLHISLCVYEFVCRAIFRLISAMKMSWLLKSLKMLWNQQVEQYALTTSFSTSLIKKTQTIFREVCSNPCCTYEMYLLVYVVILLGCKVFGRNEFFIFVQGLNSLKLFPRMLLHILSFWLLTKI